uniref:Putative secreted protein n=1 Tax=Anopheles darlingi TaxID=43151 RepID=A0A2M4D9P2_ANODA
MDRALARTVSILFVTLHVRVLGRHHHDRGRFGAATAANHRTGDRLPLRIDTALDRVDEIGPQRLHLVETDPWHHILTDHHRGDERFAVLHRRHAEQTARW